MSSSVMTAKDMVIAAETWSRLRLAARPSSHVLSATALSGCWQITNVWNNCKLSLERRVTSMRSLKGSHAVSLVLIGLLLPSLAGCGTIFGGTTEVITAQSSPSAATVSTDPVTATYTTPGSLSLERKNNYLLTFSADGYRSAEFRIRHELRVGILVADVLLTGLIGVVVDAVTGGW